MPSHRRCRRTAAHHLQFERGCGEFLYRAVMEKVDKLAAFTSAKSAGAGKQLPHPRLAGVRPRPFRRLWLRARSLNHCGNRVPIARTGSVSPVGRANCLEQIVDPERFGQAQHAFWDVVGRTACDYHAPCGRGGVFRHHRLNQVHPPLRAEVRVDEYGIVRVKAHLARFGERGSDIDLIAACAERAANQRPHVVDIVDDEYPLARQAPRHRVNPSLSLTRYRPDRMRRRSPRGCRATLCPVGLSMTATTKSSMMMTFC